jgi:hypothetical protein
MAEFKYWKGPQTIKITLIKKIKEQIRFGKY